MRHTSFHGEFQRSLTFVRGSASPSSGPHCTMAVCSKIAWLAFGSFADREFGGATKMSFGKLRGYGAFEAALGNHSRTKHRPAGTVFLSVWSSRSSAQMARAAVASSLCTASKNIRRRLRRSCGLSGRRRHAGSRGQFRRRRVQAPVMTTCISSCYCAFSRVEARILLHRHVQLRYRHEILRPSFGGWNDPA